ncbi:glycosyltransferase family 2 protein [Nitrospira moscoviensis]|uniref:Putative Glycosyl transferase family 2 n=1 Tax=Nitrospira moscoviensis TaxID=42253 RepID=A0A0K2GC78_NITMO|nr:glycosyltransferase family 2 protein [Nitrospira moscoviensis]ALA58212.1 putative Glycosyl transferase family 2 [Nitrospira moscoviensis]
MDVAIGIVNWNTWTLLEPCLRSLTEGTKGVSAQIIVVDNGSADGSAANVRTRFPEVMLIANEANVGFARGTNQAYAMAKGRYFLLLNPDTVARPGAVASMARFLDETPAAAGVTCRLVNPDGSFQRIYTRLPAWRYVLAVHTVCRAFRPNNKFAHEFYMVDDPFDRAMAVEQPSASCLMIRRALFPGPVLLDERFPILFNDTDLYRRIHDRGLRFFFSPAGEVLHHRGGGGVGQMGDDGIIDYLICLVRYYRKHEGWAAAAFLWCLFTAGSVLILLKGLGEVMLGAKTIAWLRHESKRRFRLARCRERFSYPAGITPAVPYRPAMPEGTQ